MKNLLTACCCVIIVLSSNAQSIFIKGNISGGYAISALTENQDSTLFVAGTATDTIYTGPLPFLQQGQTGGLLAKYDVNGNELSRRVYGSLLNEQFGRIIPLNENGNLNYLLIGTSLSFSPLPPNNYQQTYVVKVNANGDTLWTRVYDIGFLAYLNVIVGADSSYIISDANGLAATLTKVNSVDGDTIWTRWYKQPIAQSIGATSVTLANDSGYYIGGNVIPPGNNNSYFMLLKTDTAGMLQWGNAYGTNIRPLQCWDMIKLSSGELLMIGQTDIISQSDIGVIKLNAMGDTVWCHKYSFPFNIYDIGSTALEDNDGNYVIAGYDGSSGKAQILKVDTNGNVMWAWKYNWYGNSPMTIKKAYDGGYWVASGALVKLDSTGYGCTAIPQTIVKRSFPLDIVSISPQIDGGAKACVRTNTQEFINTIPVGDLCVYLGVNENPKSNDELVVYPNPVSDKLSISCAQLANKKVTVTVYDLIGKQKLQSKFTVSADGKIEMDGSDLENGIYFLELQSRNKMFYARFFKE